MGGSVEVMLVISSSLLQKRFSAPQVILRGGSLFSANDYDLVAAKVGSALLAAKPGII